MHVRRQIRDEIISQLMGATNAINDVFSMRAYPVAKGHMPAIIVYTKEETAENVTIGDPSSLRQLTANIEVYVKQQTDPDREIDLLTEQIENILGADNDLDGKAKYIEYQGVDIEHDGDGDNAFYVATMTYGIMYTVKTGDAGTID